MYRSLPADQRPLGHAREKRGWTQVYVATQIGVSVSTVRQWEKGRVPYPISIQKLCHLFAMSPQELGFFHNPHQLLALGVELAETEEKQAAWEIYVELVTRIPLAMLEEDQGILREVLTSLYSLFQTTRMLLRHLGPRTHKREQWEESCPYLAVSMLNLALRPLLSKWHPLLQDHEAQRPQSVGLQAHEQQWEKYAELRQEISNLRPILLGYANAFAKIAGTPSLLSGTRS